MDIKWFDQQTDFLPGIETMVVLYHELIAFRRLHHHLVVNALEMEEVTVPVSMAASDGSKI